MSFVSSPDNKQVSPVTINKYSDNKFHSSEDILAVEDPLEIRVSYLSDGKRLEKNISVTMRTPGNDESLAVGFLFTEGIIKSFDQLESVKAISENVSVVTLKEDIAFEMKNLDRHFYTSSSCGVCGKSSIEAIHTIHSQPEEKIKFSIPIDILRQLPSILRKNQDVFEQTGGLHASAIFNTEGKLLLVNEDVGRHNALDKLIGSALQRGITPLNDCALLLSGRASFELIQKATMASIPFVAAVGAPSSLAVSLAKERGMTLVGFLREDRFNVYCGIERIVL